MNNFDTKNKLFGQYIGQNVYCDDSTGIKNEDFYSLYHSVGDMSETSYLNLKSIEDITDDDAIEVAKLAHQIDGEFTINRNEEPKEFLIHIKKYTKVLTYHTSINKYCCINTNWFFKDPDEDSKVNIGEIITTSRKPVPYIAIVDYLRSKGYAVPFLSMSVEVMVDYGWIKLEQNG